MILSEENYLEHYGILRKSGRYPWGSGGTQSARSKSFLDTIDNLRSQGLSESEIAKSFSTPEVPFTTTNLRALKTIAGNQQRQEQINQAQRLKDKGYSNVAIGKRMGINESSVRSLLAPGQKDKAELLQATASMLKDQVEQHKYLDIGKGIENHIGVTQTKLSTAVAMLQEEGYKVHYLKVPQLTASNETTYKVLTKPGVPWIEVKNNVDKIHVISTHSTDGGRSFPKENEFYPPTSISSKRVAIRYAEDGGTKADGVIELRPGPKDLSLGTSSYAQVRIAVDGTHYLKGMAVYKDDLPDGVDVMFNTNKSNTGNKKDAMKAMEVGPDGKVDPNNPFSAQISRQSGHLNIVNEEGDWDKWSRNLSSQMLSKQDPALAKQQLNLTYERRVNDFKEIEKLTNPTVRRKLLESFSDETDSAAVNLKAAELPRQATKVLLPIRSMKETEIHAPSFENGTRVVLIRHPHGGKFEIPELTVNNRNPEARKILGSSAKDAVGIHHSVAERLSGADFDGDHVLVIPNDKHLIKTSPALEGLKNFDPKSAHPPYDGMKTIDGGVYRALTKTVDYGGKPPKGSIKQQEMGKISNLITDMTIRGANNEELARAVRHSMVVIDSEKHVLDYKGSARANGILQLKAKYQGIPKGARSPSQAGASTLISRAGSEARIPKRKPRPASEGGPIDPVTGKKVFVPTGESYVNRKGQTVVLTERHDKLAVTDDAHDLSSGTRIEEVYADHSNRLKSLANQARKELVSTKSIPYSKSASIVYSKEVQSLTAKLNVAKKNAPLERKAQAVANALVDQRRASNPHMDAADLKKIKGKALTEARTRVGARKQQIQITPSEWDAIQAGAISNHRLNEIINNSNLDTIKKLATPKVASKMTSIKIQRAQSMLKSGFTQAEVARQLGVSLSTLKASLSEQ